MRKKEHPIKKVIIQIPCYNEEQTLHKTIEDLPKSIDGIDKIEILVIDDGSKDKTIEKAKELGVDHIISFPQNKGLSYAFSNGIKTCVKLGADIIVNTDGDNQYKGEDISKLVRPILDRKAEVVIGARDIFKIEEFSFLKKLLQRIGSATVNFVSNTSVEDVTSGFRAYNKEAAQSLQIVSSFTYTLESIIQAGSRSISIISVPIGTNPKTRKSRLFKSNIEYVLRSAKTIIRILTQYRPLSTFIPLSIFFFVIGLLPAIRFLYMFFFKNPHGHVQSLIFSSIFLTFGFFTFLAGLIADQIAGNRNLLEKLSFSKSQKLDSTQPKDIPYLIYFNKEDI